MPPVCFRLLAVIGLLIQVPSFAALAPADFFPAPDARNVCVDTPLRLTFESAPRVGSTGRIRVFNAATGAVVDTIDLAATSQNRVVGGTVYNYFPVLVAERSAHIQLHNGVLAYNTTYYVQIEGGVLLDSTGEAWSGVNNPTWRFTTKAAPPAAGTLVVTVAEDGSGDFASIQGAFDFVPVNNVRPLTILVRNGTYREILLLRNRPFVTLRGEDRRRTVIAYANNANLNAGNARAMVGIDANDFTLENLTLRNTTPPGGSQAEALRTNSQRCTVRNVDFSSYQDTLFLNGRAYFENCTIEGDVDFIWGGGAAYFYKCEIRALRRGYNVQSRSTAGQRGYVFVECTLTAPSGVTGHVLARTDTTSFPACEVAYLDCTMGAHITPAGWTTTGPGGTENLRFLEYRSRDLNGGLLNVALRNPGSRQLGEAEADQLRSVAYVLGGWEPLAASDTSSPGGVITASPAGSLTRLVNVSVGAWAGAGDQSLIAGFSLAGTGSKRVLVRGLGPALEQFGVQGTLVDPRLQVVNSRGDVVAENYDWSAVPGLANASASVGAFPLVGASRDAGLLAPLGAGSYTAQVGSAGGLTGRAQIEVYDGAPSSAEPMLANLSARTELAAGDTLLAGFVLSGVGGRAVLIRAVGPGLTDFGLSGALSDARLEVYGASGKLFANDNWTAEIGPMFERVGAFNLTRGSRDAALLVTLPPGAYTAHVRGGSDGAAAGGVVLLEIYAVP